MLVRRTVKAVRERTVHAVEQRPARLGLSALARDARVPGTVPRFGFGALAFAGAFHVVDAGAGDAFEGRVGVDSRGCFGVATSLE